MKNKGSNLTTAIGLGILVILIFVAAYIKIPALEAFLIVITLLCAIAWVWTIYALKKIDIILKENEITLFPGDKSKFTISLANNKLLLLIWLKLTLTGRNLDIIDCKDNTKTLSWIMPFQNLEWSWQFTALSRGVCTLDSFQLRSGDGFGLSDKTRLTKANHPLRIIVFPKTFPVDVSYIQNHVKELDRSISGYYSDRTLLKYTRPYTGIENSKDINWRSLARGNEPEVNIYEQQAMHRVCFIPDLESFVYEVVKTENGEQKIIRNLHKEEFEHALSMIASIITTLDSRKVTASLIIPAFAQQKMNIIFGDQNTNDIDLLKSLAEIDYNKEETSITQDIEESIFYTSGQIFVFAYSKDTITCKFPDEIDVKFILLTNNNQADENDDKYIASSRIDYVNQTQDKNL